MSSVVQYKSNLCRILVLCFLVLCPVFSPDAHAAPWTNQGKEFANRLEELEDAYADEKISEEEFHKKIKELAEEVVDHLEDTMIKFQTAALDLLIVIESLDEDGESVTLHYLDYLELLIDDIYGYLPLPPAFGPMDPNPNGGKNKNI